MLSCRLEAVSVPVDFQCWVWSWLFAENFVHLFCVMTRYTVQYILNISLYVYMCKYFIVCAVHVKKENDVTTVGCHFILEINTFCPYNLNTDISLTTAKLIIVIALSFTNVSISLLVIIITIQAFLMCTMSAEMLVIFYHFIRGFLTVVVIWSCIVQDCK